MFTHDTVLPNTTVLPETAVDPVALFDQHAAPRFAIVEHDHAMRISADEWDKPGVHVLWDIERRRVGGLLHRESTSRNRTRLREHVPKDH